MYKTRVPRNVLDYPSSPLPPTRPQNGVASALVQGHAGPRHTTPNDGRSTAFGIPQWHCGPPVCSPLGLSTCSVFILMPEVMRYEKSASVPKLTSHSRAWHEALRLLACRPMTTMRLRRFLPGESFTHSQPLETSSLRSGSPCHWPGRNG